MAALRLTQEAWDQLQQMLEDTTCDGPTMLGVTAETDPTLILYFEPTNEQDPGEE